MIHLNKAPIFLEFLQKVFDNTDEKFYHKSISDEYYIAGKCGCNASHCATVILKKRRPWKKKIEQDTYPVYVGKGYVSICVFNKDYVEIECTLVKFPHKHERNQLLNKNGKIIKSLQVKKCKRKKIDAKKKIELKRYFNDKISLYEELIYTRLCSRGAPNHSLFQHVR